MPKPETPRAKGSRGRATRWDSLSFAELCEELTKIEGMPPRAIGPLSTALILCSPMPSPVRNAWTAAKRTLNALARVLDTTKFDGRARELLFELNNRLERRRAFSLVVNFGIPPSDPDFFSRESEGPSRVRPRTNSIERGLSRRKRKNFEDLLVLAAGVLRETGLPMKLSPSRQPQSDGVSVFEVLARVLDAVWSDDARSSSEGRSAEHLRTQHTRALRTLRGRARTSSFERVFGIANRASYIAGLNEHVRIRDVDFARLWYCGV
jgi:hypothetical protein